MAQASRMKTLPAALLLALAAPGPALAQDVVPAAPNARWRSIATEDDRERIGRWRQTWVAALAQARAGAHAGEIERGGALFEPDAALAGPAPPAGDYDCRTYKLGAASAGMLDFVAYPAFHCRIRMESGRLRLTKLTGSQRPVGELFTDNGQRMIFLGTLVLGDESRALRYGRDRERNLIGLVERIGPERWRIVFPSPAFESLLDVIELIPRR
jgi:hypothetical protein